ncbi:polysaccharide export protein [Sphingomonas cannabina]|uniref:polysaccharide biosynthesis/export family protein n=1 Tax=Sphingomonas cannabina TaxID=2899123 RepID=UPI001F2A6195|nr:polysaccharide biosynthesis/export family protein [Sphingomonas cannabina]UIJ43988.1 polysaccharide export protein [Sphingomonas cannabina]
MKTWTRIRIICLAAATAAAAGCSNTHLPDGPPLAATSAYTLGPGDRLRVTTFGFKDLSGEYEVATDGTISLSLIEPFSVRGMTPAELEKEIAGRLLAANMVRKPQVSCEVLKYRPYYILGEVRKPGQYPFSNGLTALKAVATAEGFTYRANAKTIYITRDNASTEMPIRLTASTPINPGDTIRVGERYF